MLGSAILLRWQIFDRDDVQRIECGNLTVGIQYRQTVPTDQYELRMGHRVFMTVRCPQSKGPKSALEPLSNALHVHGPKLASVQDDVNTGRVARVAQSESATKRHGTH